MLAEFGDTRLPLRFWSKVRSDQHGCWGWVASTKPNGYAQYAHGGTTRYAHRVAYAELVGKIPAGLTVDHLCRVRHCVNPGHMDLVTQKVNNLRGNSPAACAARVIECPQNHPYDAVNTGRRANGKRYCKTCNRAQSKRWSDQRRSAA